VLSFFPEASGLDGPLRRDSRNPHFFTDNSGKSIYLTGTETHGAFQPNTYGNPDYIAYINSFAVFGHNHQRMRIIENAWIRNASPPWVALPMIYKRTGPGLATDGGLKFDLNQLNDTFYTTLRSRIVACRDRDIYVMVMFFIGNHVLNQGTNRDFWGGHPYHRDNNINGINGDPNGDGQGIEIHSLAIPAITRLQETYIRRILDTLNDLDNVYYEVGNELRCSDAFPNHIVNFVHAHELTKPKQHMVGRSMNFEPLPTTYVLAPTNNLYLSPADWVAPTFANHDSGNPNPPADSRKVTFYDTDHNDAWSATTGMILLPWKAFTRGMNMTFADCFENPGIRGRDPNVVAAIKRRQGQTLRYSKKVNLVAMRVSSNLSSTMYCMASTGAEYLVYQPRSGAFSVNLAAGTYAIEWFNPSTNVATAGGSFTAAAGSRGFTAPFGGEAVLYLKSGSGSGGGGVLAPSITTQPVSITVTAGQTATFRVVASGTAPLAFQWQRNGVNISGATGASYTTPATSSADSGAIYRILISNSAGSVTSAGAVLTVTTAGTTQTNAATFVSQSVPTSMTAGSVHSVSVTMRNSGTSTWTAASAYKLGSQNPQDNSTWGSHRANLAAGDAIAPGQSKTFTFNVTAPGTARTYNFQWRMVRENVMWFGGYSNNVGVTVSSAPVGSQQVPYGGVAWDIPGTIQAENFDVGGEGIAYHDVDASNIGGAYRTGGVDIAGGMDGSSIVGWTKGGEWLEYTVNVTTAGNYTLEARVSSWDSSGRFHVEFNGVNKTGTITMPVYTGTRQTVAPWLTLSRTVSLSAGRQVMKIALDSNGTTNFEVTNLNYIRLTAQIPIASG
jgi:hypothetical protein